MNSALLNSQIRKVFGKEGEARMADFLHLIASNGQKEFVEGINQLLELVSGSYDSYAGMVSWQGLLSQDAYSDWNLVSGQVRTGQRWKALLGYPPESIENTLAAWQKVVHQDDLRLFQGALARHVKNKDPYFEQECRLKRKDGEWQWFLLRGSVTERSAAGEPARLMVMHRDISAIKDSEKALLEAKKTAEMAMEARGAFLANMSHEIRTPMNGILGMTELALDTDLDAEQRQYLKTVKSSSEALLTIVNDILDFSKIESGMLKFEQTEFLLSEVVVEATRVLAVNAHKKNLELIIDLAPDVPNRVCGDPTRLRQIVLNLVGNAVKFTAEGEIYVRVRVESASTDATTLLFSVTDSGIGIPEASQKGIFDAFTQADESTTRRFGGTGLGLAICKRLVELMGGTIRVESTPDVGSTFSFSASFRPAQNAALANSGPRFAGRKAIVLEDNRHMGQFIKAQLESLGIETTLPEGLQEGVIAIERNRSINQPFDLIFADIKMPPPAGLEIAENWRIAGQREKLLMLLNTENQRADLEETRRLEVSAHLVKPLGRFDIQEAITLVLGEGSSDAVDCQLEAPSLHSEEEAAAQAMDILLVEDNPVNQELALRMLHKKHHRVTLANNGAEAVDLFETRNFDVIFMDMQMPVLGGIEATEAIRAKEMRRSWVMSEEFVSVYIIAMTANSMNSDREKCHEAGMNDFISKPIRQNDLFEALERARQTLRGDSTVSQLTPEPTQSRVQLQKALDDIGDLELLVQMATMFVTEWDSHLQRINSAIVSKSPGNLAMHAHSLRSLLSMFHADQARIIARSMEDTKDLVSDADWAKCRKNLAALEQEMILIRPEIDQFIASGNIPSGQSSGT